MKANRGSEWNRWDMHIHTPFSVLNNSFNGDFDEYVKKLFTSAIENNIVAIGITDYFSINGYKMLKEKYFADDKKLLELFSQEQIKKIKNILILPNIEFRLDSFVAGNLKVDLHVIFSDSVSVSDIENNFLNDIKFIFSSTPNEEDDTRALIKSNIEAYGQKLKSEQGFTESNYYVGIEKMTINLKQIKKALNKEPFKNNYIVVIPPDESISKIPWNGRDHAKRKEYIQSCNCFFTSNQSSIDFGLGKKHEKVSEFINEFKSLKPSIHGSDAHGYDELFEPDMDRYCWIKAMPNFYGLQQILYEPEERVRIQQNKPEERQSYYIIDSVEIDNDDFMKEKIYFSDKMTCIIGGKSTGKSLLLHNIANVIDSKQVDKKCEDAPTKVRPIDTMKVSWKDGYISLPTNQNIDRKIIYIPQTYLNRLSDEKEETTEIDKIILEILLQDDSFNSAYNNFNEELNKIKSITDKHIYDLVNNIIEKQKKLENEILELGGRKGIENEYKTFLKKREDLLKSSEITEKEIKLYDSSIEKIRELNELLEYLSNDKTMIKELDTLDINKDFLNDLYSNHKDNISSIVEEIETEIKKLWVLKKSEILESINVNKKEITKEIKANKIIIDGLKPKIDATNDLKKINDDLEIENKKLKVIKKLELEKNSLNGLEKDLIKKIISSRQKTYELYQRYSDSINDTKKSDNSLEFELNIVTRSDAFKEKMLNNINKVTLSRFNKWNIKEFKDDKYTDAFLEALYVSIKQNNSKSLELVKSVNLEGMLRDVFSDWYNIDYVVKIDGDTMYHMSPGKKALVLLKLLIELAESKCPILIDQPEDDLDNRSIYDELIIYLKTRKKDRQIIIVTHNANIVLGGDAEQIIVANQSGTNAPNNKDKFEYRMGAIEDNFKAYDGDGKLKKGILNQKSIQEHICEILEGGEYAFDLRRKKYHFSK